MGNYSLLQGSFWTQGSNLGLLHCRQDYLPSEPPGKPKLSVTKFYYAINIFMQTSIKMKTNLYYNMEPNI